MTCQVSVEASVKIGFQYLNKVNEVSNVLGKSYAVSFGRENFSSLLYVSFERPFSDNF